MSSLNEVPMDRTLACMAVAFILIVVAAALFLARRWRGLRLEGLDYLILTPVVLSMFLVELPLLTIPNPSQVVLSLAQGSCAASATVMAVYPVVAIDHRRSEKAEAVLFVGACVLAALAPVAVFLYC